MASIAGFFDGDRTQMRVLLIEGEAGIGKTTLWEEAVSLAENNGPVLMSRPSQAEIKLSFSVLGDLVTPILPEAIDQLPAGQRSALEAALLVGSSTPARPDARAVSLAVRGTIRSVASLSPITLAIDDVQWVDASSARTLAFAFRRLADEPVTLIAAKRIAPGLTDPLDTARMPSLVQQLTLGPMALVPLGRLLAMRLGRQFASPSMKKIHDASGGNPFFALEIGRALQRDDARPPPGEPLPVPAQLDALLRDRLMALSGSAMRALLVAACSAMPTSSMVASAVGDVSGLDEAEAAGIVALRGGTIEFTHPLLAASVYGSATSAARRDVHVRLARIATDLEERARHLALSVDWPDEEAAAASEAAALQAEARGAPSVASDLYELAATLTPPGEGPPLYRRRFGAAGNLWAAGDIVGAHALNERLLEVAESGPERAHALYIMASESWNDVPRVIELLMRALGEVDEDRLTRSMILQDRAWAAIWACDPRAAISWADASLEVAETLDEAVPHRQALSAKAMALRLLGRDSNGLLERAIKIEGALDYNELSTPRWCLGLLQMWEGRLDSARASLEEELDQRAGQGRETLTWEVRAALAEVEFRAGHWTRAAAHAREAHDILLEAGWTEVLGQVLPVEGAIACAMGNTERARKDAVEALSLCERMGDPWDEIQARSTLGFLELSSGDHAACNAWLEPLIRLTDEMGLREPGAFPFVPDEVEALVVLGDLEPAQSLTDKLEEQGRELGRPLALATAARCRGLIAAAGSDLDAAEAHLTRALSEHESQPQPFELGRTLLVAGVVQRRMRRQRRARELLQRAVHTFEELGASVWAANANGELGRVGGRAPAPEALTPTEESVAHLVSEGLSNREVAESLFMSVHTVDAHLRRIYRKLDVRSRTELARRF
jgi:DNA-binding CsgD family transcriptional regulator